MLEELIELLGHQRAMQLCAAYGGQRIYIAHRPRIVWKLDQEVWQILLDRYRNDTLDVPLAKRELARWMRDSCALPVRKIAADLRVDPATVRRYLSDQDRPQAHPTLFDSLSQ